MTVTLAPPVVGVPICPAFAVNVQAPEAAVNVLSDGQVMVGASGEMTLISCVQLAVRPPLSVTVQMILVLPIGYAEFMDS